MNKSILCVLLVFFSPTVHAAVGEFKTNPYTSKPDYYEHGMSPESILELARSTTSLTNTKADITGPFNWSYISNFPVMCATGYAVRGFSASSLSCVPVSSGTIGSAYLANNQTFSGINTFLKPIVANITGNAATSSLTSSVINGVYTTTPMGGDLSGFLPSAEVIDDSHNHTAATLFDVLLSTSAIYSKTVYSGTLGQGDTFYAFVPDTDITLGTITATVHYHGTSGSSTFFCGNSSGLSVSVLSSDSVGALKSTTGSATITGGTQVSCFISATTQTITPTANFEILYTKD